MKMRASVLSWSVARGIAVMCAAVFVATARPAHAGINVWTSHGPLGGNVSALAIDPNTPQTLYAATVLEGVFKSIDGGDTWNAANTGLPDYNFFTVLAIDPNTPSTLYAGTSYGERGANGVYKSTDEGTTWSEANAGLHINPWVTAFAIDPDTPSTLYAGTYAGVFKSTDAGATWSARPSPYYVSALAIDPNTPSTLYAGTRDCYEGCSGSVFKSTDAGATWREANAGLPVNYPPVYAFAIDANTPQTLYAAIGSFGYAAIEGFGVFKSTDAGATWSATGLSGAVPHLIATVLVLAIDPITNGTLYAGTYGAGVFKSTDGGSTWNALNTGLTNTSVNALAIDPMEPRRVYAGTYGGGVFGIEQIGACVGDCSGTATVAINDLVTLVTIALGNEASACPNGLPAGSDVDVAVLIEAVNNALHGCGG